MAKARMISKDACDDVKLNRLSIEAQLLYLLTLPHLDRDGLVDGRTSWLAGHCLTERMELHTRIGSFVEEWLAQGLVTRYQGNNGAVLFFHGFRKHNPNLVYEREQESKFPAPPGFHRGDAGLIPDDPEVAGRLTQNFDIRSRYRVALTEAAKGIVDLAESLGLEEEDTTQHKKIMTSSRPDHDEVTAKRREVKEQQQVEVKEKTNNNMRALTLKEAEKAVVVVGVPALLDEFDHDQAMALLSWLWLYNGWYEDELSYRDIFRRAYNADPFAGMKQPGAVIVKLARAKGMAPLAQADREDMMTRLTTGELP